MPKAELRHFEAELLRQDNWTEVQEGLEARLVEHPDGNGKEKYVLCRSNRRAEKERAMLTRQMDHLTQELMKIDHRLRTLKSKPSDLGPVERRIGRWLGKYPAAARLITVNIVKNDKAQGIGLQICCPLQKGTTDQQHPGTYLLRTNCTETDPAVIWRWYVHLTQAEAAFRTSKSDIGLRPIYHQKTERVEAHLLIFFLGLAMWRSLEMWMAGKGLGSCARKLLEAVQTVKSMDIVVPVKRDETEIELRLRTVAKPDEDVATLLAHLGLSLPRRSKIIENVVKEMRR